ncbi:hypothetical protein [Helicobacter felis]|uniref:hypothetical protein n=1 Tax=Helicobacter felis TaxID=214 RepID=UPI001315664B|nr:hypothetical protein [Helicobacter felis]
MGWLKENTREDEAVQNPMGMEGLPGQEAYPCADYHDDVYLCAGKRLVKDRYGSKS